MEKTAHQIITGCDGKLVKEHKEFLTNLLFNQYDGDCEHVEGLLTLLDHVDDYLNTWGDELQASRIKEARTTLHEAGYAVSCLWSVDDVINEDESFTIDEAEEVLKRALESEGVMTQTWSAIFEHMDEVKNERENDYEENL